MSTRVITGKVRASYVHIFEPHAMEEGQEKKYSMSLIISKSDTKTLEKVEAAISEAIKVGQANKWGGKLPPNLKTPLRDGDIDRPDDPVYKDAYFINATSIKKPDVVDQLKNKIEGEKAGDVLYSGCYVRVSINFYAFNVSGNKGIAAGLNNVQKYADGEKLGGGPSAEEDFDELDFDDDDDIF